MLGVHLSSAPRAAVENKEELPCVCVCVRREMYARIESVRISRQFYRTLFYIDFISVV